MSQHRLSMLLSLLLITFAGHAAGESRFLQKLDSREVEAELQVLLSALVDGRSTPALEKFKTLEARTWDTFQALPKNDAGRLAPQAVRYITHGYFARHHGWLIKGLEPHGMQLNTTEIHEVNILQEKAPHLVQALIVARQAQRGLSFLDVVSLIGVLEQMMLRESLLYLQQVYRFQGLSEDVHIDEDMLHKVLQLYLVIFQQGSRSEIFEAPLGPVELQNVDKEIEFERDTVFNYEFRIRHRTNPFRARMYSFEAVVEIMEDLTQHFGKWQDSMCSVMKSQLKEIDPHGLGRIPLGTFYAHKELFRESADYLRQIGALDETSPGKPYVFMANYIAAPSNCIADSSYFSVCCLSECDELFSTVEHYIAAPEASPSELLAVIGRLADDDLPKDLLEKLHAIAEHHNGEVPLHGRLFAQWLHFAFPQECPYPSIVESKVALKASYWILGQSYVTPEERNMYSSVSSTEAMPSKHDIDISARWSDVEVLPVFVPTAPTLSTLGVIRMGVQLLAICLVLGSALGALNSALVDYHNTASGKASRESFQS